MKLYLIALIFLINLNNSFSQYFNWAKGYEGLGKQIGLSVCSDTIGNIYTMGSFENTIDLDPSSNSYILTSDDQTDYYISKQDSLGDFVWGKKIEVNGQYLNSTIISDSLGNLYVCGQYNNFLKADINSTDSIFINRGSVDLFIAKINQTNGDIIWLKTYGSSGFDLGRIYLKNNSEILFYGRVDVNAEFSSNDSILHLNGSNINSINLFLAKINSIGEIISLTGYLSSSMPFSLAMDNSDNIYLAGTTQGTTTIDNQTYISNASDLFICKIDITNDIKWYYKVGGMKDDYAYNIVYDNNSGLYISGKIQSNYNKFDSIDFDPSNQTKNVSFYNFDLSYLLKIDTAGNFNFVKLQESGGYHIDKILLKDTLIYTSGSMVYPNIIRGVICKFKLDGSFFDFKRLESNSFNQIYDIHFNNKGHLVMTGLFSGPTDFDFGNSVYNLTNSNNHDAFTMKMSDCIYYPDNLITGDSIICTNSASYFGVQPYNGINEYLWSTNGNITNYSNDSSQLEVYFQSDTSSFITLKIQNSCQKNTIDSLNLNFKTAINPSVISFTDHLEANQLNANYQWIDCNSLQIIQNENNRIFYPKNIGEFAVEITFEGCIDTSNCYLISTINSIDELTEVSCIISPNPSEENITIESDNTFENVSIYSEQMELIEKHNFNPPTNKIKLNLGDDLSRGIYFIKIQNSYFKILKI
jgi:hypothetical protein